jgi:hypothetical protein
MLEVHKRDDVSDKRKKISPGAKEGGQSHPGHDER